MFDIVQWALDKDHKDLLNMKLMEPTASRGLVMHYDDGVEVEHRNFGRGFAVRFFDIDLTKKETNPKDLLNVKFKPTDTKLYVSESHENDWVTSAKEGSKPICDVEVGQQQRFVISQI